jgi:hypothetical protein
MAWDSSGVVGGPAREPGQKNIISGAIGHANDSRVVAMIDNVGAVVASRYGWACQPRMCEARRRTNSAASVEQSDNENIPHMDTPTSGPSSGRGNALGTSRLIELTGLT